MQGTATGASALDRASLLPRSSAISSIAGRVLFERSTTGETSEMVNYKVATATRRYLNLIRRVVEVVAVLFLAFVTTILTLCFGWVGLLFKSSPGTSRVPVRP
jgi:hypothetical protein